MLKFLDPKDSLRLRRNPLYSPHEVVFMKRNLRAGEIFYDIGAHIGYFSDLASRIVGASGEVHAFEPDPRNMEILKKNLADREQITFHHVAVSDFIGIGDLYLSDSNSGDHQLFESPSRERIRVAVISLDYAFSIHPHPVDFLKIDAQGLDDRILRGARNLIESSPKIKGFVEYSPFHLRAAGSSPEAFFQTAEDLRLNLFMQGRSSLIPADIDLLLLRKNHLNLFFNRRK